LVSACQRQVYCSHVQQRVCRGPVQQRVCRESVQRRVCRRYVRHQGGFSGRIQGREKHLKQARRRAPKLGIFSLPFWASISAAIGYYNLFIGFVPVLIHTLKLFVLCERRHSRAALAKIGKQSGGRVRLCLIERWICRLAIVGEISYCF
jgi:hypothetical protein